MLNALSLFSKRYQRELPMSARRGEGPSKNYLIEFLYLGVSLAGCALLMKWSLDKLDPSKANKKAAAYKKAMLYRRLGRVVDTNNQEEVIACDAVNPDEIDTSLADVGGLEETKAALKTKVILPLKMPQLFSGFLLRQAKGVLLYGPPGTGKTMLAKALAKEAGANFVNIRASTLQSKWFGETQKLTNAVFTLAHKLQPCIIFIDEAEAILGRRRDSEHEAVSSMKTEFMQLWDGFTTDPEANVMVLAATNRPFDLDDAVLRRFSLQLEVGMPNAPQREAILKLILKRAVAESSSQQGTLKVDRSLALNVASADGRRPLAKIAEQTDGFSGSDLMELCSRAAVVSVQEHLGLDNESRRASSREASSSSAQAQPMRTLQMKDFAKVLSTFEPSTRLAEAYRVQMASHNRPQQGAAGFGEMDRRMADYIYALLRGSQEHSQ